jgi:hypothetical protein
MAWHQPLVPVLPVARELISKTKWTSSKPPHVDNHPARTSGVQAEENISAQPSKTKRSRTHSPHRSRTSSDSHGAADVASPPEVDSTDTDNEFNRPSRPDSRTRMRNLFKQATSRSRKNSETSKVSNYTLTFGKCELCCFFLVSIS